MKKNLLKISFLFFMVVVFGSINGRSSLAASASSSVSIGMEVKAKPTEENLPPKINIQEMDWYQVRFYGKSLPEGEIHLHIEGPDGYGEDVVVITSYLGNWEHTLKELNAGEYKVRAYSVSNKGVQSPTSAWERFEIFMEPPKFKINVEGSSQKVKISGTAAFPGGKVKLVITLDNGEILEVEVEANKDGKWSYMTQPLDPGKYDVIAYAYDKLNNRSEKSKAQNFEILFKRNKTDEDQDDKKEEEFLGDTAGGLGQGLLEELIPIRSLMKDTKLASSFGVLASMLILLAAGLIALRKYFLAWGWSNSAHLQVAIHEDLHKIKIFGTHFPEGKYHLNIFSAKNNREVLSLKATANRRGKLVHPVPNLLPGKYSAEAVSLKKNGKEDEILAKVKEFEVKKV